MAGNSRSKGDRAAIVWQVTFPGEPSLSSERAEHLGKRLERAATRYLVEVKTIADHNDKNTIANAEEIARLARVLSDFLKDDGLSEKLSGYYQFGLEDPSLDELSRGLALLRWTAVQVYDEAKCKSERISPVGNSSVDRHIFRLADVYEETSPRKAGASQIVGGAIGGPFVRFVAEASSQFAGPTPGGSAIRAALVKRRNPSTQRHVIRRTK